MTRDEIVRHLTVGGTRSVVVDVSLSPEFPGRVREVTIHSDYSVTIEFCPYGYDEGCPRFRGQYTGLEDIIADLEAYLKKPLAQWENFTRSGSYPEADETAFDWEDGGRRLKRAVALGAVPLPSGVLYELRDGWWRDVASGKVTVD